MLTDPQEFLRFFDSIHRRTLRDIQALPAEAQNWTPPVGEGEKSWSINQIVHHICESRMYFSRAYRNEGGCTTGRYRVPNTRQNGYRRWRNRTRSFTAGWMARRGSG